MITVTRIAFLKEGIKSFFLVSIELNRFFFFFFFFLIAAANVFLFLICQECSSESTSIINASVIKIVKEI